MKTARLLACLLPLLAGVAHAQDERRVVSPDGRLEFRLGTGVPEGSALNCLAYQVWWRGKQLLDTSYLGLNIHFQEPLLGENVGLSSDKPLRGDRYNGLFADYLQTSTTGRRIQLEIRVWNDGVAFRYIVPRSPLLLNLLIEDEATQYRFAGDADTPRPAQAPLPYVEHETSGAWVGLYESRQTGFPAMTLKREDSRLLIVHLPDKPHDPKVAFEGPTPWTGPWRILVVGSERGQLANAQVLRDLVD